MYFIFFSGHHTSTKRHHSQRTILAHSVSHAFVVANFFEGGFFW